MGNIYANLKNFDGFQSQAIYGLAGIGQTSALIFHIFLLNALEDACTKEQTENSRGHITAAIVLNAIGLLLCMLWVFARRKIQTGFLAVLNDPFSIWLIKVLWIAFTALGYLFSASVYGLTIALNEVCTDFDGIAGSFTALLLYTAGLAIGHLGAKKHKYELMPGELKRQVADQAAEDFLNRGKEEVVNEDTFDRKVLKLRVPNDNLRF